LSTISLELDSRPESVALVRGMLAAVAELLEFEADRLDDVKIAVSEACNNVVLHAYGEAVGPLLVGLELTMSGIEVIVRDRGIGMAGRGRARGRLGVGLPMMETLADQALFLDGTGGGTEVRLTFASNSMPLLSGAEAGTPSGWAPRAQLTGDVVVLQCPIRFLGAVMGRMATMLAAGARFSLDRLSDVRLLTDAIAARTQGSTPTGQVGFALGSEVRRLEIVIGPFDFGFGAGLRDQRSAPGTPSLLPLLLADDLTVESLDELEVVRVVIRDRPPPGVLACK
jgi:serine/threonine-protein kinase RsbW